MIKAALVLVAVFAIESPADARLPRDHKAVAAFQRSNPCPSTGQRRGACPGWVVDHVIALECRGLDHPSNMQWQTVADGKAKDKWERKGCVR